MKIKFVYISFLLLFLCPYSALGNNINWVEYEKGIIKAGEENKPIFLHFSAQWCGYCRKMAKTTFKNKNIISYLNENFISIKIDTDANHKLASKYNVSGLPDNRFMDKNGEPIYRVPGFMNPTAFEFFLEYIHSSAYKTMDPMTYYKSKKEK